MLQRIQTIFLSISAVCMAVFLFVPVWSKIHIDTNEQVSISAFSQIYQKGSLSVVTPLYYLAVLAIFAVLVGVFTVLQYKNRVKQMLFVALNSLLMAVLVGLTAYHIHYKAVLLFNPLDKGQNQIGFYVAIGGLLSNWLANRFIRADEKKVRDADRMR